MTDIVLTERQTEVVEFVRQWWAAHGYGPSMQDIGDGLTISRASAHQRVRALAKHGWLTYTPRVCRSTRPPGMFHIGSEESNRRERDAIERAQAQQEEYRRIRRTEIDKG